MPGRHEVSIEPLDDAVDHVRGPHRVVRSSSTATTSAPYSRKAYREIERVERRVRKGLRFAFRHFPVTEIHSHALAASVAAEAAALQNQFWNMHELLFHHQTALEADDLLHNAVELDIALFDNDLTGEAVRRRVRRDVQSGIASGEVRRTPTLFIDGEVHLGAYDADTLFEALAR